MQDNRLALWAVGELGSGEYLGEPQLLCDIGHDGDVMDMQVTRLPFLS